MNDDCRDARDLPNGFAGLSSPSFLCVRTTSELHDIHTTPLYCLLDATGLGLDESISLTAEDMAGNPTPTPDFQNIQNILASLAQFASVPGSNVANSASADVAASQPIGGEALPQNGSNNSTPWPLAAPERTYDPRLRPQGRTATLSPKPMIDPATITTWQEGLRCVTKIAAQNSHFAARVRKVR